ncbi:MAG: phosphoribosylaminoimidazolesuccinocarboxamide synthase, partial [Alphaproteobacteria bacterium]|nr:phosphoribosylaminoimidazolesuccinocarboxamide synthase [Alphaproteobacteria bacterium]
PRSVVEFRFKADDRDNPMVSEEHITAFGWATPQELDEIMALSLRINDFLSGLFVGVGIRLVDFKLEYGRHYNANDELTILLADEISPDSCRLWDVSGTDTMDKGQIHRDMSGVAEAYQEVAQRLGILPESGPRDIQGPKVMQ